MNTPVTFLTGASSGIGWALAHCLVKEGHAVALAARRKDRVAELESKLVAKGGRALALECDVEDRDAVHRAVAACEKELGPIDRLIANAGVGIATPGERFDAQTFEHVQRTNVLGVAYCVEAVVPGMVARGAGHIVGISSLASFRGLPLQAAYCASKAAVSAMLESLRIDLAPFGVAVTTICPGFIKTPMTANRKHPMPFLLDVDDAAGRIHRAIVSKKRTYSFPWPFASLVKTARFLPAPLWDRAVGAKKRRRELDT